MAAQVRDTYGGSIAAFLVGAVGIALPWFVVNSAATKVTDISAQVWGLVGSFFVLVALGVLAAPILGAVAWRVEHRSRGLYAMYAGLAVGGIIGFLPVIRASESGYGEDLWLVMAIVIGGAALLASVGWGLLDAIASRRRRAGSGSPRLRAKSRP